MGTDSPKDETMPDGKWAFDADVTAVFEDMLTRSIPQYEDMRQLVTLLSDHYLSEGDTVIDIGCSHGGAIKELVRLRPDCQFIGIEISEPMALRARMEFDGLSNVIIRRDDIRARYPQETAQVVISNLTLQFIPIEYRQRIIQNIYNGLQSGGVLILVEKILGSDAEINDMMVHSYYQYKQSRGYSVEQIERKRLSLEGVLVPVTAKWNEQFLEQAGFARIDSFWRWMNFAGWIAVK